ncbi:penicillin-binding protein 2 [Aestuariispira insulae]|uniref:Peptidoglycan glycosyltransferase n=1 Tax=Aestuariispira insulae TaxID=1461337 RepID=A0A3D9HXP6_9PROT|nr:penicillin-binding protein 2 [Aestuariispira insulae]RED54189.1 peptidoglycan glycosyltransferase [Aestuariispira insulae]
MKREKDRARQFNRRAALLLGGKFVLMSGLAARMYYLQVIETDRYKMMADDNRINLRLLPPPRGFILDRNGDYLAINIQNYRIILVREQAENASSVPEVLARLGQLIDLEDHEYRRVLKEVERRRAFVPVTVRENLSWEEVSRIGVNTPELPGVTIDVGQTRHYPYGPTMAHVLGYVAAVSEKDNRDDPLLQLPGFKVGKRGVERYYDLALRGQGGTSKVEVNALGRVIRELERNEGQPGHELRLSLDMRLQDYIGNRVADEKAASVVVMDVHNGEVLGLVSTPSFNPNAFSEGLSTEEWKALQNNPYKPLSNKTIAGQYAPGSTFKMSVALAALDHGISPDHRVFCPGHMDLGNHRFHCWKRHGHGWMNMTDAIRESCDVWFYEVGMKVGIEKIAAMARKLGLGDKTGLDLHGERAGLIPDKAWKERAIGERWQGGETVIAAIGQGYVLTTPLQLAVMTARMVNGGKAVVPHLTKQKFEGRDLLDSNWVPEFEDLGIPKKHLDIVLRGMDEVVNHPRGTANSAAIKEDGTEMGGKTGTAQVRRISEAERKSGILKGEDISWRLRDHGLFVGFAPVDNPRFAISVVVEHGGGSKAAIPIAKDVMVEVQRLMGSAQSSEAEPRPHYLNKKEG